jgi:hypothetical protein
MAYDSGGSAGRLLHSKEGIGVRLFATGGTATGDRGETSPMRWVRFGSGRASLNPRLNGDIQALVPMIIGQ